MNAELHIDHAGWRYRIQAENLHISRNGDDMIMLPLAPALDGAPVTTSEWRIVSDTHLAADIDGGGSIHLAVEHGHVCYWCETPLAQIESLTYFGGGTFSGGFWQTYMSDEHDRRWYVDIDQEVGISSAYDRTNPFGADGRGMTDPGDFPPYWIWNIPVRAFSLMTDSGWVGFSIPGPLPTGVVRVKMDRRNLSLGFDVYRASCQSGLLPKVYFVTLTADGPDHPVLADPYDILLAHRAISDSMGLTVTKQGEHPAWWSNPHYKYWDEYLRTGKGETKGVQSGPLKQSDYLQWLRTTRELTGVTALNVTLEQGCFSGYGDYRPTPEMGGAEGVREMVDRLRTEGTHVGHYVHPYLMNTRHEFYQAHPEAFCRPRDPSHKVWWPLDTDDSVELRLLDWTHPLAREFAEQQLRFLYSDAPGCLNCDIVRSNNWLSPDPRLFEFHDPDWGIGDMMTWKVQRFIYETAKRIKPDICVWKVSIGDPYMQPWADVNNLPEEWNGYTDNWYRRGRIATRTVPDMMFHTDSWFTTLTKGYEYYMGLSAWIIPETESVRHTIHPYMTYRELQDKDFKRRKAGFHTYLNAPVRRGDLSFVDWTPDREAIQRRKHGSGPLAGFYAGLAIGKRTFVTFSEAEARIATSVTRTVTFPFPQGAVISRVEMVPHEGDPEPWDYELISRGNGPGIRMHVIDCGERALYYRITYALKS
jgi:hypothetical protein